MTRKGTVTAKSRVEGGVMPGRPTLVDLIAEADAEVLSQLRERIAQLEEELAAVVATHRREIDSLRAAAKIVDHKLHGKPTRAAGGAAKVAGGSAAHKARDTIRQAIHDLVAKEGSMPVPAIASRLGRSNIQIAMIVRHCDWFRNVDGEVHNA